VASQLLRPGTSPYPNHGEAQRWIRLIEKAPLFNNPKLLNELLLETEKLIKIFVTSIKTTEKKKKISI